MDFNTGIYVLGQIVFLALGAAVLIAVVIAILSISAFLTGDKSSRVKSVTVNVPILMLAVIIALGMLLYEWAVQVAVISNVLSLLFAGLSLVFSGGVALSMKSAPEQAR